MNFLLNTLLWLNTHRLHTFGGGIDSSNLDLTFSVRNKAALILHGIFFVVLSFVSRNLSVISVSL